MTEKSRKPQKMPRNQDGRKLKRADDSKTSPNKNGATIQTLTSSALPKLTENKLPVRARTSSIDSSCSSVSDTSVALDLPFSELSPEQISPRAGGGKRLSIDSLSTGNFASRRQSEESGDRVSSWWNNTSGMGPGPTNPDWTMERSRRSSRSSWSTLVSASDSQLDDGEIEDGGSANVSVVVRVRPLSEQETKRGDHNVVLVQTPQSLLVEGDKNKQFTFNHVFDGEATQQDVLDECGMKKLVDMALEGYNCTAFAYGQTGSGKTYTITGPQKADGGRHYQDTSAWGLIQHSLVYLFDKMRLQPKVSFYIKTSYLEIYNEQVKDLLNLTGKDSLPVRWSKDKGFYVENLFVMECETLDDMLAVLEEGLSQKAIATNNVNEHSSRSHTIMSISIDSELPDPDDNDLYITKHGKLSFVDLAGSEKVKELGSSSELLSETTNINKSLLTLGNCISSLSDNRKRSGHIPYRDSKLTKLLADSLGGTGITLMIACISPSSYCLSESINTLRYAVRARRIKNKPVIRMDPREKLITSLKREVRLLRSENQYLRQRLEFPGTAQPSFRPVQEPNNNQQQQHLPLESVNDGDLTPVPNGRMVEEPRVERTEAPMEGSRGRGGGPKDPGPVQRDTQVQAKSAADNSLYEMLQEYMVENETLRSENSDLHSVKEKARREQDSVARENDRLLKKLEELERVFTTSPYSLPSTFNSRTSSGQSIGMRGNNQPSPLGPLHQSPPLKTQRSPQGQLQRSPQGQANGLTHQNSLEKRPSGGSPWRQQSGELPPVDGIKGIPDNYRSSQQRQPLLPGQRDAPPTQRSFPSMSTQPPHHPPPTNHSYPRAHTNQSGLLNSTHPPLGHGQPPTHRGSKKGSDSRVSNTSQSYPPPPASLQASYAGSMGPLHEDHQQAPPPVSKRDTSVSVRSSLSNPSVISKPQSKADIYIPSAPSTGLTKDTSQRRDPAVRHDLQTIEETGAHPASTYRNPPPPNNHPTVAGSHSNPSLRKPPSKPVSTANTAATGYSNKSKKNAWSGAGGSGTGGGGGGVGGGVSQPSKNTTAASSVPINNIPKTPVVTPPVVKYKPQGSNKMLAATTNNLDINYKGPDSDSLKDLNQKLREELQALDGEIEYMKYVNKNKPNAPAGKGKRR